MSIIITYYRHISRFGVSLRHKIRPTIHNKKKSYGICSYDTYNNTFLKKILNACLANVHSDSGIFHVTTIPFLYKATKVLTSAAYYTHTDFYVNFKTTAAHPTVCQMDNSSIDYPDKYNGLVWVTWNVLSWSGDHEFEPQSGWTLGAWYLCPKSYLNQKHQHDKCFV